MVKKGHIEIKNVTKHFSQLNGTDMQVLENTSLDIPSGEFVCFMGPSGCGKTTLLRLIAGLIAADEGQIFLDGEQITGSGCDRGLVFQDPRLFKWMNIEENVAFGLKARKVYKKEKEEVQKYIDMVGLRGFEKSLPHHLSGGMQQRAAFARALVNKPTVLLLDEPFGALDAFTRAALQEKLTELWKQSGTTTIMVTHDVEEAVVLATKIVVMSDRPAEIKKVIDNELTFPRDRNSAEAVAMKKEILDILHLRKENAATDISEEDW